MGTHMSLKLLLGRVIVAHPYGFFKWCIIAESLIESKAILEVGFSVAPSN